MRKFRIKIKLSLLLVMLSLSEMGWCADGDEFTSKSVEGVDVAYQVINEREKVCQVGGFSFRSAIDQQTRGKVTIPASVNGYTVEAIGDYAFGDCHEVTAVSIPASVKRIGDEAFHSCKSLKDVTIGSGVKLIGRHAFHLCEALQQIVLPEGLHTLGAGVFAACFNLQSVSLPKSLRIIGNGAFSQTYGLTHLTLPEQLELIDDGAFAYCYNLQELILPQGLKYIGQQALPRLQSLHIPASVCYIGGAPCYSATNLTSITVDQGNSRYDTQGGCNGLIETATGQLLQGCKSTIIPSGVKSIADYAFRDAVDLTSINIPEGVTTIGQGAFQGAGLTSVHLPSTLKRLGGAAFSHCSSLTKVSGGENLEELASEGSLAFSNSPWDDALPDGISYIGKVAYTCKGSSPLSGTLTFKEGTRGIGGAFALPRESSVTAIVLPEGLTNIGEWAFNGYNGLQSLSSIKFPKSLQTIGEGAFQYCNNLTELDFPEGLTWIGDYAFNECKGLASLTIPSTLSFIGSGTFKSTWFAPIPWYDAQPDGPVYAGNVFLGYKGEIPQDTHLTIAEGTLGIAGEALNYLESAANIESISLPNSLTSIGQGAFSGCSSLTSITIPAQVKSLGDFILPQNVQTIWSYLETPLETNSSHFAWDDMYQFYNDCKLMVPAGSRQRYEQTFPWCLFQNIEEFDATSISHPTVDNSSSDTNRTAWYSVNGVRRSSPQRGLNIMRGSNGVVKKVLKAF